jgi:ATP-binding cassette subfamily F protein 3
MLFVSHNRSFVNQLATRIWEVKDGVVEEFPGNLADWEWHQRQVAGEDGAGRPGPGPNGAATASASGAGGALSEKERRRMEAESRNARLQRERPLRQEIARLEAEIAEFEKRQREAEAALADPALYTDFARARPHVDVLAAAKAALPPLYEQWEEAQQRLETLSSA